MIKKRIQYLLPIFLFVFTSCSTHKYLIKDGVQLSSHDEALYTLVQKQTFQYFWDGAEPNSGMARERFHEEKVASFYQ